MHYSVKGTTKLIIFVILAKVMSSHRASGFIANISRPIHCQGSTATIDFDFNLQGDSIVSGSKVWLFNRNPIAEDTGSGFMALNNYTSRLTSHSSHGLTLSNVTTADNGTYEHEILLAAGLTPSTATTSLTVYIAPLAPSSSSGCSVNTSQSGNTVTCSINGNCGTPPLNPSWVNFTTTSNQFECTVKGTYHCCATSAALTSCYSGSPNDFCTPFDCATVTTTTTSYICLLWLLIILIILLIFLILIFCGCLDCCKCCRIFDHYEESNSCYVTWYFIKRGCCSFFFCKSGSKSRKCFCGNHKAEHCGGCLYCWKKSTCGWPGNCKTMDSSCGGYWFCVCCGTQRRDEEDPLIVCIDNKDALCRTADDKMTITCSVNGYGPGDIILAWTGPQGNELTNSTKHKITPYNKDTGKSSLTISYFSSSDNGQYSCHVTYGDGFFVEDSIVITVHDADRNTNRTGPPVIYIGTQNKVESKPTSMKISDRCQPLPPVAAVTEDIPKRRPHPPTPENSDAKDPNKQGISANFDDSRGLPTDIPRSSRLLPLTHNQSTLEEEDASEKPPPQKKK